MIRLLAPRPQVYDLGTLLTEARTAAPGVLDVNEVDPDLLAGYWPDDSAPTGEEWAAIVAAHAPAAPAMPVDLLLDATDPRDTSRIRRSEP